MPKGVARTPAATALALNGAAGALTVRVNNAKVWHNDGTVTMTGASNVSIPDMGG